MMEDASSTSSSCPSDTTERKQAEAELARYHDHLEELVEKRSQELEESRARLQHAQRLASIGTLAAGIAHEINNPLGMIMLSTDSALRSVDKPEAVEKLLRRTMQCTERCSRIVKNVLRFARYQSTEKHPVVLNDAIRLALDFNQEYARKNGVTVETHLADTLCPILANATDMEQVGVNLVQNAVQSCSGDGHVTIDTSEVDGKVRLVVRDNGCGMAEEVITHACDPFFTTRLEKGGTGLGLSTVHGIVTEHEGTIEITSKEGIGTTLTLEFPRCLAQENEHYKSTDR